ncbi:MAG: DUF4272 domain-containing protein [Undibacterium umbellatum]|uniref:DUF4272 domain-containing protein n=1 Tax=Undibacterium umbellatum TaxID=2762300 RepID=UPI003BB7DEF0
MLKILKNLISGKPANDSANSAGERTSVSTFVQEIGSDSASSILINAYSTCAHVPPLNFPHKLNSVRDLHDPDMHGHLQGFIGYVLKRGDGQMTHQRYHVMRHIQRVQQQVSLWIDESQLDAFSDWAVAANAIVFMQDGDIRDPHGYVLLAAADGEIETGASVPYPPQAWQRKARTNALLAEKGLAIPAHLPPLVSEDELQLRPAAEILGRALALYIVALRAESVATNQAIPSIDLTERFPQVHAWLSPDEREFLETEEPEDDLLPQFAWRYESLYVLEWVLGLQDELTFADAICDVPLVARTMMNLDFEDTLAKASTRPASQILDALDLHYRLHWLVREARMKEVSLPLNLEAGVIYERHYALNWLVNFENAAWDEVDTPT